MDSNRLIRYIIIDLGKQGNGGRIINDSLLNFQLLGSLTS